MRILLLPAETAALAPGVGLDSAQAGCGGCHSADYITTQPRGLANPQAFWTAEVVKMRNLYKAPCAEADIKALVEYLVAAYGK
jgi:mono/diheme cytochrome c family protein